MIVICEECGKNYRVDPAKIQAKKAHFKCSDCGHQIIVFKPDPGQNTQTSADSSPFSVHDKSVTESTRKDKEISPQKTDPTDKKKPISIFVRSSRVRFGITAKLFFMMIIISLVPLLMFWGIMLKQTKDRIHYEAKKNANQQFLRVAHNIDEWFDQSANFLKSLVKIDDILSMDPQKQQAVIDIVQLLHPKMNPIFTIDPNGLVVAGKKNAPLNKHTDEKYFKDIISGKSFTWQTWTDPGSKKTSLVLAVPIIHTKRIVGILSVVMSIDNIYRQALTFKSNESGLVFLVRDKGRIIAHPLGPPIPQLQKHIWQPLIAAFDSGKNGLIPFKDSSGKAILGFVGETSLGWGLALQKEETEVLVMIEQEMSFAYLLLAVTVGFVLIIAWFSGRALSRPIIKLTNAADRISVGELDMEIRTHRKDEIGDLAESIARMQDSIRVSIERLRRRR